MKIGLRLDRWNSGPGNSSPVISFEPEISTYISGLNTPLSPRQISRLDAFVKSLKSSLQISLLSDAFDIMYIFAGESSESSLRNIVKDAHHATPVNAPAFNAFSGFLGNGVNAYIHTNYNPGTQGINYKQNSAAIGAFSNTNVLHTSMIMGTRSDGTLIRTSLVPNMTGNITRYYINHSSNFQKDADSLGSSLGFYILSRTDANNIFVSRGNTILGSTTQVSTGVPNNPFYVLCYNNGTAPQYYTPREVSIAFAGRGLSQTEIPLIDAAFEQYKSSL